MSTIHFSMPSPPPDQMVCDFCSGQPVRWSYPARPSKMASVTGELPFGLTSLTGMSADAWAACEECHQLIKRADRDALMNRAVENFPLPNTVMPRALVRNIIRQTQDNFWAAREGAPDPHEVSP